MPFALVIIGLLMVVTGAKDTHVCLGRELQSDFTGPPSQNFMWWVAAIGGLGALGAIEPMRGLSKMLMALTVIAMVLAQSKNGGGGFFGQLVDALKKGPERIDPASCGGTSTMTAPSANPLKTVIPTPSWLSNIFKLTFPVAFEGAKP